MDRESVRVMSVPKTTGTEGQVLTLDASGNNVWRTIPGSETFIYNRSGSVWEIYHDLHKYPSVTLTDISGNVIIGDIEYQDNTRITIRFTQDIDGRAYLN